MYKLEFLPSAVSDILEIEAGLYEYSPAAADNFTGAMRRLTETLANHPLMYKTYDENAYFRSMNLPYKYRLFFHVDEKEETIKIHRILHGMRDLKNTL